MLTRGENACKLCMEHLLRDFEAWNRVTKKQMHMVPVVHTLSRTGAPRENLQSSRIAGGRALSWRAGSTRN